MGCFEWQLVDVICVLERPGKSTDLRPFPDARFGLLPGQPSTIFSTYNMLAYKTASALHGTSAGVKCLAA